MLHLFKTLENQDFEMALISADKKELLQAWYQLYVHTQTPSYGLQPIASHILKFKVWNKIYIYTRNGDN